MWVRARERIAITFPSGPLSENGLLVDGYLDNVSFHRIFGQVLGDKHILRIKGRIIRKNKSKAPGMHFDGPCHHVRAGRFPGIALLDKFDKILADQLFQDTLKNFFMLRGKGGAAA